MLVTQISFGGFDKYVTALELKDYLEYEVGVVVMRCRLKTSWTPPESYPNYTIIDYSGIPRTIEYDKVEPHAFVHFAIPDSAKYVMDLAGQDKLLFCSKPLKVSLGPENPYRINQGRRDKPPYKLTNVGLEIGNRIRQNEFFVSWRRGPNDGVDFLVDPWDGTCKLHFTKDTAFSFKDISYQTVVKCNFKMEFLVREINGIRSYKDSSSLVLLLQLASSPSLSYRTADDDIEETLSYGLLDDDDPWIRTTDFTPSGSIGRCYSYRISIPPRHGKQLDESLDYFKNRRVPVEILREKIQIRDEPEFGKPNLNPFFCIQYEDGISFDIMFLLNAVIHKGIVNQHQLSVSFFDLLRTHNEEVNVTALKHIFSYKCPIFDAYKRLKLVQGWLLKNPKLIKNNSKQLEDVVEVRRLVITPTRAYCLPPAVELSNRVLRHYKASSDRFLRVTFMDEGMKNLNSIVLNYFVAPIVKAVTSNSHPQKTTVFKRVNDILHRGFLLCGRKYSFLAFSANQLRDRSAWFFAETESISVSDIKKWMGKFRNKNVAKCAARMGQCFSSTYSTVQVPSEQVNFDYPDIKRNGYTFSDGIGMVTPDLAMEVAEKLQLKINPPCGYQIRFAGCKGVIVSWPGKNDGKRLSLRPSMNKFESKHNTIEVCGWTRFQPGFLNRQIITLLSALGVSDGIFWNMQNSMVSKLNQLLHDTEIAFDHLAASCSEQGNTAAIMLSAGFKPDSEPHLRGMLTCIRAGQLWGLREKSRIFVKSGRWMMGVLDEVAVLEQGQCFIQVSTPSLEDCFARHGSMFSDAKRNLKVVTGTVVIAKNPCLHPGDVRILEAVDVQELYHLTDCLVFPQNGKRPHTNEASGSDLDGDTYFVTWEEDLIPPSRKSWEPMDYDPVESKQLPRGVNHKDIINFFAKNMVNDSLGTICNAHVVHADLSEDGALDENCIKLAELAATAVDFPKTGREVRMPYHLKPKIYPDFMGKEEFQSYVSKKILGRMYREIKDAYDDDMVASQDLTINPKNILYDKDLEIIGYDNFEMNAWKHKCSYDGQLKGLLGQYKVNREEEVVTGHIWSMPKYNSKKQGELKERLHNAYSALKKEFRQIFEQMDSEDFDKLSDEEKNKMYEQKASAWYQVSYHPFWLEEAMKMQEPDGEGEQVMLSFAWIAADYLARIKIKRRVMNGVDSTKPINMLARYIADRI